MAHLVNLTDGTTTVYLESGGNHKVLQYVPQSPALSTVDFAPQALQDGGERVSTTRRNVTEPTLILFSDTTTDNVRADIRAIELMLKAAEEYENRKAGVPVYVQFQPGVAGDIYRSEILSGKVEYDEASLAHAQWNSKKFKVHIVWTRRYYWEANSETELALTNGSGSGTGGRTISNPYNVSATNKVSNPGFETAGAGGGDVHASWTESLGDGVIADTIVGAEVHGGTHALKLTAGASANTHDYQDIVVVPGQFIQKTFWARGDATNAGRYRVRDVTNAVDIVALTSTGVTSATYAQVTVRFYAPATCVLARIMLYCPTSGTAYFDDVEVVDLHENYVQIAAADVAGAIPAPVRLEITNTFNDAEYLGNVYIGHNAFANPATLPHIIEAETATGGTSTASAAASGGYYRSFTWATDVETLAFTWALSAGLLSACAGQFFNVLAKWWLTCDTGIKYRLEIRYGAEVLWSGQTVSLDTTVSLTIRSLGGVQLPPWVTTSSVALSLLLYVKKAGGGTVNLDLLQLTPTDSIRSLLYLAYGTPYNSRLVDDGITNSLYEDSGAGTARAGFYEARGAPLMLWPDKLQRLYFLQHGVSANSADIDRTASVRVYHRPRRLTL